MADEIMPVWERPSWHRALVGFIAVVVIVAAVWGGSEVSSYFQAKRAAGIPHGAGGYYYYSPQERVDELFWEMLGWFEPLPLDQSREDLGLGVSGQCDESMLLEAEADYGDMPEYWQLRYAVENSKRRPISEPLEPLHLLPLSEDGLTALEKAVELAPDDPVSMWLYGKVACEQGRISKRKVYPYLLKGVELKREESAFHSDYAIAVFPHGDLDNVYFEYEEAVRASNQRYLQGFPTGYAQMLDLDELRSRPECIPNMASLLFSGVYRLYSGNSRDTKDVLRKLLALIDRPSDCHRLTILHRYACSCALWEPHQNMNLLTGLSYQGMVRKRAEELGIATEPENKAAFNRLDELRHEAWGLPLKYGTSEWLYGGERLRQQLLKPGGRLEYETGLVFGELSPAPWVEEAKPILREMMNFDYENPAAFVEGGGAGENADGDG